MRAGPGLKLELRFRDRIGIVADISERIAGQGLNIASMEVERAAEEAHVYVDIEGGSQGPGRDELLSVLREIPGLIQIRPMDSLPHEERENRFRVVLDNVSDGVVSIDRDGRVTTINRAACRVLGREAADALGRPVTDLGLPGAVIQGLEGKQVSNIKQDLITRNGRYQYFSAVRPIRDSEGRILGAVEFAKDMQEIRKLARAISSPEEVDFRDIVGDTPPMKAAIALAQKIAATDAVVSIRGESGTGKELFARAIHKASGRPGPFVPINCAALPEHLLETELFGYEGGAFTGGKKQGKAGLFEIADKGTLLLDEIADMSPASQAKILRTIQGNVIRRIGGIEEIPVSCRVITATNRNLKRLVDQEHFREDLYYRINVLPIHIPPLRDRPEDIPPLVESFLSGLAAGLGKEAKTFTRSAMEKLRRHHWPGNVRELKNVVERAGILCEEELVDHNCIFFSNELEKGLGYSGLDPAVGTKDLPLKQQVAAFERTLIRSALKRCGSIRGAARSLKISHTALMQKVRKHRILEEGKGDDFPARRV